MDVITFETVVGEEGVIRPPEEVLLPLGRLEVVVRPPPDLLYQSIPA